jgi:shikimate dehydrogenase
MIVNTDTKLFFSISAKPGNFGARLYNTAFQQLNINAIYKPLELNPKSNFFLFLEGLLYLKPSGLSISMPFKTKAYEYASKNCFDDDIHKIKNVNTYKFREGTNIVDCYNTDCYGFENSCSEILKQAKTAVIYGNGAVSKSIQHVLRKHSISFCVHTQRDGFVLPKADFLINATPLGMDGVLDDFFTTKIVENYKFIFDVVVKKRTNLSKLAEKTNKIHVTGPMMSLHQLHKQFEIYTGYKAPVELFLNILKDYNYV